MKIVHPKVINWDLECSSLNANGGFIICAVLEDARTRKQKTFKINDYKAWKSDPWNDFELVRDISRELGLADVWVTYYGKKFDLPFLNTRIAYWRSRGKNIDFPSNIPHIDLYHTAKFKLRLHSNRLQVVSTLLGHGDKTSLDLPVWLRAAGGHVPSINYVVTHCKADARILTDNYLALKPLIARHPHMGLLEGRTKHSCASCGSGDTQNRGTYATEATIRQRLWCKSCGRWSSTPVQKPVLVAKKKSARGSTRNTV